MAWFAVHLSIYGAKLREMYHRLGCSEYEAVGILNALWGWGLSNAEKDGFLPFAGKDEIARFLYSRSAGSSLQPEKIVSALVATGWLDETEKGICIHDWDTWQEQWYKALERRKKDAQRKRESRWRPEGEPPPDDHEEGHLPPDPPPPGDPPKGVPEPAQSKYSKDFEEFWIAYPRKIGKSEAYKKYKARLKDGFSPQELLAAAVNYAAVCKRKKTEDEYIKHGKTFLSENTPFIDYLPKKEERDPAEEGSNPFAAYMGDPNGRV